MSKPLDKFQKQYEEMFPPTLLAKYEIASDLAFKAHCETLLLKQRATGRLCVAKVYAHGAGAVSESSILRELSHPSIPRVLDEYEEEGCLYVVREYVEGKTLAELCSQGPMRRDQAVRTMRALCQIIAYLQRQVPPVVHRDIKPSNIVQSPDGRLHLIDFEIARRVDPNSTGSDTVVMATLEYASPEHFGYQQTDGRSDIYSMGVLLMYLLTGNTHPARAHELVVDHRLAQIIEKCTQFAPKDRYQRAESLDRALSAAGRIRSRSRRVAAQVALVLLALAGGFGAGLYYAAHIAQPPATPATAPSASLDAAPPLAPTADLAPLPVVSATTPAASRAPLPGPEAERVVFRSPAVEKAVRAQLSVGPDEPVYVGDLMSITELILLAGEPMDEESYFDEVQRYKRNPMSNTPSTAVGALDDVRYMTSLKRLFVSYAEIESLAPLSGLTYLHTVRLVGSHVLDGDFSPLATLPKLTLLDLHEAHNRDLSQLAPLTGMETLMLPSHVEDYSFLKEMKQLICLWVFDDDPSAFLPCLSGLNMYELAIHGSGIHSIAQLRSVGKVYMIRMYDCPMEDLSGIAEMDGLQTLKMFRSETTDFSPLLSAPPSFKAFHTDPSNQPLIERLGDRLPFEVVYE